MNIKSLVLCGFILGIGLQTSADAQIFGSNQVQGQIGLGDIVGLFGPSKTTRISNFNASEIGQKLTSYGFNNEEINQTLELMGRVLKSHEPKIVNGDNLQLQFTSNGHNDQCSNVGGLIKRLDGTEAEVKGDFCYQDKVWSSTNVVVLGRPVRQSAPIQSAPVRERVRTVYVERPAPKPKPVKKPVEVQTVPQKPVEVVSKPADTAPPPFVTATPPAPTQPVSKPVEVVSKPVQTPTPVPAPAKPAPAPAPAPKPVVDSDL